MIKPELYHKTVGILFDAYFSDTLEHGNCCACAVGNLVGEACGYSLLPAEHVNIKRSWGNVPYPGKTGWATVFCTEVNLFKSLQIVNEDKYVGLAKEQIDSTGYTWQELAKIEYAFEMAEGKDDDNPDYYMFNGLVAVLEVLAQIHQVTDEDLLTANNKRFKDHYNKRLQSCQS